MKQILKCLETEWLFSKIFTNLEEGEERYSIPKKRKKERIVFVAMDEEGMMVNLKDKKGEWFMISWDEIKGVTLYYTMNPYDCLSFAFEEETKERVKMTLYFEKLRQLYPEFHERFYSIYDDKFSLYIQGKKRNIQLQIPSSWIDGGELQILREWIEEMTNQKIEIHDDEEIWKNFFD